MKKLLIILSCLTILGCASVGTKIDQDKVSQIKEGVTTKQEVIALLGNPYMNTLSSDSKEILMYQYAHTQTRPSTMIPVVGLFTGGADTSQQILQVLINKDGVVEKYTFSTSNVPINSGLLNSSK